ncbi:MAG: Gfo/Idh/MocA family oxidoreductase [Planctomycetota bacterium]
MIAAAGATSDTKVLRTAVVGFGKMGLLHAGLASGLPGSDLVAVVDKADTLLNGFRQQRPELAGYDDVAKMLDAEKPDAVFITSPTHLHVPHALECATRGIPFLVEKPLSPRGRDVEPLRAALREQPVTNAVGYMARHIGTFAKGRDLIASGVLGTFDHLRATMYVSQLFQPGKGWRYDKELSGGGVLVTQNSHLIDLLLWIFGPLAAVNGHTKVRYSGVVDDFAHAYLQFENGLTGYLDTSWSLRHHRMVDLSIDVHGERGTLTLTDDDVRLFLEEPSAEHPAGWNIWRKPDLFQGVPLDVGGPEYTLQDAGFLDAVAQQGTVASNVESAYQVQRTIDAIYESAANGGSRVLLGEESP